MRVQNTTVSSSLAILMYLVGTRVRLRVRVIYRMGASSHIYEGVYLAVERALAGALPRPTVPGPVAGVGERVGGAEL